MNRENSANGDQEMYQCLLSTQELELIARVRQEQQEELSSKRHYRYNPDFDEDYESQNMDP